MFVYMSVHIILIYIYINIYCEDNFIELMTQFVGTYPRIRCLESSQSRSAIEVSYVKCNISSYKRVRFITTTPLLLSKLDQKFKKKKNLSN